MQKFTVFSIILSISILLVIGDIIFHDYLNDNPFAEAEVEETVVEEEGEEEEVALDEQIIEDEVITASVELPESEIWEGLFASAGFTDPVLKEGIFSGLIYQFINFSDQTDAFIYQWNLFNGVNYIGTIYEIKYPTDTGSFQGYLALRERAFGHSDKGQVNEVNNYGDASFYFNHGAKTKTVHLVIRKGSDLYAFEYSHLNHELMKKVFDLL